MILTFGSSSSLLSLWNCRYALFMQCMKSNPGPHILFPRPNNGELHSQPYGAHLLYKILKQVDFYVIKLNSLYLVCLTVGFLKESSERVNFYCFFCCHLSQPLASRRELICFKDNVSIHSIVSNKYEVFKSSIKLNVISRTEGEKR